MTGPHESEVPVRFLCATYFPPAGPYFQKDDEAMVPESVAQMLGARGQVERMSPTSAAPAATVGPMSRSGECVQCRQQRDSLDLDGCCGPCLSALLDEVLEQLRKLPPGTEIPGVLPPVLMSERDRL